MNILIQLITLYFSILILNIIYIVNTAITAVLFKIQIIEINISGGLKIFSFQFRSIKINFGLIPINANIIILCNDNYQEQNRRLLETTGKKFEDVSIYGQIIVSIAGCMGLLLLALLVLGYANIYHHLIWGFYQIFDGALKPFTYGHKYLREYFNLQTNSFILISLSILATKMLCLNLIPYLGSTTFQVTSVLFKDVVPKKINLSENLSWLLLIPILIIIGGWLIALVSYIFNQ